MNNSPYLLVYHGSRDRHFAPASLKLTQQIEQHLQSPVNIATLECSPIPLREQITQLALNLTGIEQLQILPIFLSPGVHIQIDLPAEIEAARVNLGASITLQLHPYLGSHQTIIPLLQNQFEQLGPGQRILLAHGSRYPGGNEFIARIAAKLEALPVYSSLAPLNSQLEPIWKSNPHRPRLVIVPYFIFHNKVITTIEQQLENLREQFTPGELVLGPPLETNPLLGKAIATVCGGLVSKPHP